MIYCSNCGSTNEKESTFCQICGKELYKPTICKDCGKENPPRSIFCSKCGSKNLNEPKLKISDYYVLSDKNDPIKSSAISKINEDSKWTESCPVCRNSRLNYNIQKAILGLVKIRETYECANCGAIFEKMDLKDGEAFQLRSVNDPYGSKSGRVWLKYKYKTLKGDEWAKIQEGYRSYGMEKIGDVKYFGDESLRLKIDTLLNSYFFRKDCSDKRNIKALEELKSRFYSDLKKEGIDKTRIDQYVDKLEYNIIEYPDPFLYRYYPVLGELLNYYLKDFASSSIEVDVTNKKIINVYNSLTDLLNLLTEEKIEEYTTKLKVDKNELNKILNKCLTDAYDKIVDELNSDYYQDFKNNFISTGNMLILESEIRIDGKGTFDWEIVDFLLKE